MSRIADLKSSKGLMALALGWFLRGRGGGVCFEVGVAATLR